MTRLWGGEDDSRAGTGGNGQNGRQPRRKRNPATVPEESEDIRRANELLLRVWENIYSKRDKFGKFD